MEAFSKSFRDWKSYPSNLPRASDFPYITESYISKLDENDDYVFRPQKGKLVLSDLIRLQNGMFNLS
jgi:hypothetical protein